MIDYFIKNWYGILGTVASIVIPILVFLRQKNKKELSYKLISATSLIVDTNFRSKLKILVDNQEIKENIHLVLIKVINSGNVPIRPEDFVEEFEINTNGNILLVEIKDKKPDNIRLELDYALGFLGVASIKPMLLNPKEEFTLKLLITPYQEDIKLQSRIVGIREITPYYEPFPWIIFTISVASILLFVIALKYQILDKDFTLVPIVLSGMLMFTTLIHLLGKTKYFAKYYSKAS